MNVIISAPEDIRQILVDKLCADPGRPVSIAYFPYPLSLPLPPLESKSAIVIYEDGAMKLGALVRGLRRGGFESAIFAMLSFDDSARAADLRCTVLAAGADDVQDVNIDARELLARISTIMRRSGYRDHQHFRMPGGARYHAPARCLIAQGGARVQLSDMQNRMFEFMILAGDGIPVSKDDLMEHFYPDNDEAGDKIIHVVMCKLRDRIMRATGGFDVIETVYGKGYRFVAAGFRPQYRRSRQVRRAS